VTTTVGRGAAACSLSASRTSAVQQPDKVHAAIAMKTKCESRLD
jgi:hypothetical protein